MMGLWLSSAVGGTELSEVRGLESGLRQKRKGGMGRGIGITRPQYRVYDFRAQFMLCRPSARPQSTVLSQIRCDFPDRSSAH